MRRYLLFLFLTLSLTPAGAQPKYEVRAAWVTAVYGLDWPQTKATTPAGIRRQQEELIEILDKLKAANFNTVLFRPEHGEMCSTNLLSNRITPS